MDRSRLSIPLVLLIIGPTHEQGVLLMLHNNFIGPTHGYYSLHINIVQTSFSIVENEKKIVDLLEYKCEVKSHIG